MIVKRLALQAAASTVNAQSQNGYVLFVPSLSSYLNRIVPVMVIISILTREITGTWG
jgi:hypothetical protein